MASECSFGHGAAVDAKWLRDQLKKTGRKQNELAAFLGLQPPQVNKMAAGKRRIIAAEADRIREFFGLPPTDVALHTNIIDAAITPPVRSEMRRDIPILGTVSGGVGALQMNGEPIDWARRPPRLEGRSDVFGLYVEDLSMVPAFRPGALVLVERAKPPAIGDDIVIEIAPEKAGDDPRALIKHLVGLTATEVRLFQHNPAKEFTVPRKLVIRMYRVLTMADLLGV